MATRKANAVAPAANIPQGDAIDLWINAVEQDIDNVVSKCDTAFRQGVNKGFDEQLAASEALGITYEVLSAWNPKDARTVGDKAEDRVRDLHYKAEPQSSSLALAEAKKYLGYLSNACEAGTVNHVRNDLNRRILPAQEKDATPANGVKVLQDARAAAIQVKDNVLKTKLDAHIAAIGDVSKIVELCAAAQKLEKANSRFRARLYLRLVSPLMTAGKVPTGDYEVACNAAMAAHKKMGKLSPQERTPKLVKSFVETSVNDWIAENYGTKVRDVRSNTEIGLAAAKAIMTNARTAAKMGVIPDTVRDVILAYMTAETAKGGAGIPDPTVKVAKKTGKVAAAKSTKAQKKAKATKLPSATPRRARTSTPSAPPSKVVTSTTADEDVLADLTV